ncbi:MAG: SUMF1/EgtB/PvdO family nonheme iron enzyme [Candidatus Hydrogenedens sp.]|nr:SUMF1/EgtB/PvdO family nonheme iron enzyme [Candidatus Hydrogenedens sp.]
MRRYSLLLLAVLCTAASAASALEGTAVSGGGVLDTTPPEVSGAGTLSKYILAVYFSRPMLSDGLDDPANYHISGAGTGTFNPSPDLAGGQAPTILYWYDGEMRTDAPVTISATGLRDVLGNPIGASSAQTLGLGSPPEYSDLVVAPSVASPGESVEIRFSVDETLDGLPVVRVEGKDAAYVSGDSKSGSFVYALTIPSDALAGPADIEITGFDLAGNLGVTTDSDALRVGGANGLPLYPVPLAILLVLVGIAALRYRRRHVCLLGLALAFAAPAHAADPPEISNVFFQQRPSATGGTEVLILYDLDAPNGPCDITVMLSKNGGADGYPFSVTSLTGDVSGVATGTAKAIIWDIASDYPNQRIANARLQLKAEDNYVQTTYTLDYAAGTGGTVTGNIHQVVSEGADGEAVVALADIGYAFVQWSDGVLTATRTDLAVSGNISVTAEFVQQYLLTYAAGTGGSLSGNASQWVSPGGDGTAVTAIPDSDYAFDQWSDGVLTATRTDTGVTADLSVTASFTQQFTLHYEAETGGTLTGNTDQIVAIGGDGTTVVAVPDSGYEFLGWSDGYTSAIRLDTNVTAALDVAAYFLSLPEMITVAPGSFDMGDPNAVSGAEQPVHTVALSQYSIGKFEVTVQQFCDVLNWAHNDTRQYLRDENGDPWNPIRDIYGGPDNLLVYEFTSSYRHVAYTGGRFIPRKVATDTLVQYSTGEHPIMMVTWHGAALYTNWLSSIAGLTPVYDPTDWSADFGQSGYRLPTEAEWERAAAWDGSKHWIYPITADTASGKDRINYFDVNPGYMNPLDLVPKPYTSPVGWFDGVNVSPNGPVATQESHSPIGAYDMGGNVWEWCNDWYDTAYYGSSPASDPAGPASGVVRIIRGGAWTSGITLCRSAKRAGLQPDDAVYDIGFRLAR